MGFAPNEVNMIVKRINGNPKLWLRFMMHEELGLVEESFDNPFISGLVVAAAFFVAAWIPGLPYFFINRISFALTVATALSVGTMIFIGIAQAKNKGARAVESSGEKGGPCGLG